ncbi:MAG: hypothetical protein GWN00_13345 [Aliifodinibius sp.]|nr:hypothetical protein [Fodinibius sp.]NIV12121.1 hypothetical protein [Fodinibius sp.]NIY25754.1 hypothetical protein [Fodinibius sp.]
MTTYQTVIDKAELLLQDEETDQNLRRWTETELMTWAKDGEKEIVKIKPDANAVIESVQLGSGSAQTLPSRAIQLLDVLSNMGTNGSTRGNIISVVERSLMDAIQPDWMITTAADVVTHVIYDPKRVPKIYWVYPQSTGNNYIEIITGKLPDNGSNLISDDLEVGEEYENALLHYILAMAFAKDSDIPQSGERMVGHMTTFLNMLGRMDLVEQLINPHKVGGQE